MRQLGILENKRILRVSDSFDRPDNASIMDRTDTGQVWNVLLGAAWGIVSNTAYASTPYGGSCVWCNSGISNCRVSSVFSAYASSSGIIARKDSTNDINTLKCISLRATSNGATLQRWDFGSPTTIGSVSDLTLINGDIWTLECNGNSIKAYQNGILRMEATESAYMTNTRHGLMASGTIAPRFDNFTVEVI